MITLRARATATSIERPLERRVWLLVDRTTLTAQRAGRAYLGEPGEHTPAGFDLYLTKTPAGPGRLSPEVVLPEALHYLGAGDIISLTSSGELIRVLWRHTSRQNSVLLTERCDHYCLMCSQPPKRGDDSHLLDDAFEMIRLLPRTTSDIAFTGGEPTLYGGDFLKLLRLCRNLLPFAEVHTLSNGRRFADPAFSAAYAEVNNPRMMIGIPIYGAEPTLHDYVVQSRGAFDDTLRGILNLGRDQQRIEIRVVLHKQTIPKLPEIAEFIARNLTFVDQVALMGLEMIGLARANIDTVWIDPWDYRQELVEAVRLLDRRRIRTMVYNHPLCLTDRELWPFAVRSISDWKNEYHPECAKCAVASDCSGFFYSAKYRVSAHVRAFTAEEVGRPPAVLALAD